MAFYFAVFSVLPAIALAYIPHFTRIILQMRQGNFDNTLPRSPIPESGLIQRLSGAHKNQLETLGLYAAGIVASVARNKRGKLTDIFAAWYLAARAAYVVAYAAPQVAAGSLRSVCFVASLLAIASIWLRAAL